MRARYVTVKIPHQLATELDALMTANGYHSRAEVVNDAIRRFVEDRRRLELEHLEVRNQPVITS